MTAPRLDHAAELATLAAQLGPFALCDRLGLKYRRAGKRAEVCCPWHAEKTASCTIAIGPQGSIRVHCFACGQSWNVHALVAQLRGLDVRRDFRRVLTEEADAFGYALERTTATPRPVPVEPSYPDHDQVLDLIASCTLLERDPECAAAVADRGLVPQDLDIRGLAYALPASVPLPAWARYRGRSWLDTGHRIIVPVVDAAGVVRSVRASRVAPGDTPKRLPPAGHKASGLVMADAMAVEVLRAGAWPSWAPGPAQVVIAEGEPDFWTWAVRTPLLRYPMHAVLGIFSGAWTAELAARIPDGATVAVWTDKDSAGDRYAQTIADSLAGRCSVIRGEP